MKTKQQQNDKLFTTGELIQLFIGIGAMLFFLGVQLIKAGA